MDPILRGKLIVHLSEFVSESRLQLIHNVLKLRTRYITVLLENIYQSQNASAVLRTCDCFGIQDIHIVENDNKFNVNPKVVMGATKWLNIHRHNTLPFNTSEAIQKLRNDGYRIVATSPHANQSTLDDFDVSKGKFVLLFGTELNGLSHTAIEQADEHLLIPTHGFSESLNISVSAAICIHTLKSKLVNSSIEYQLSNKEQQELLHDWLRLSVKSWRSLEKRFISEHIQ